MHSTALPDGVLIAGSAVASLATGTLTVYPGSVEGGHIETGPRLESRLIRRSGYPQLLTTLPCIGEPRQRGVDCFLQVPQPSVSRAGQICVPYLPRNGQHLVAVFRVVGPDHVRYWLLIRRKQPAIIYGQDARQRLSPRLIYGIDSVGEISELPFAFPLQIYTVAGISRGRHIGVDVPNSGREVGCRCAASSGEVCCSYILYIQTSTPPPTAPWHQNKRCNRGCLRWKYGGANSL